MSRLALLGLVHQALAYLSTGQKGVLSSARSSQRPLLACATEEIARHVCSSWPADRLNQALALAKNHAVRIGQRDYAPRGSAAWSVEDVHAGWAEGFEVGTRRVFRAEKAIIRQAQAGRLVHPV